MPTLRQVPLLTVVLCTVPQWRLPRKTAVLYPHHLSLALALLIKNWLIASRISLYPAPFLFVLNAAEGVTTNANRTMTALSMKSIPNSLHLQVGLYMPEGGMMPGSLKPWLDPGHCQAFSLSLSPTAHLCFSKSPLYPEQLFGLIVLCLWSRVAVPWFVPLSLPNCPVLTCPSSTELF